MTSASEAGPRPDSGPKNDVLILMKFIRDGLGEGIVWRQAQEALRSLETEKYEDALINLHRCWWMIRGAINRVEQALEDATPSEDHEADLLPWVKLEERVKICMHWVHKLPEEMRLYKQRLAGG